MSRVVLTAYGWTHIQVLPYGTHDERFEDEVIDRRFAVNGEHAADEKRLGATVGAKQARKGAPKRGKATKNEGRQLGMLGDEETRKPTTEP
jgi:hypothetical protein